MSSFWHKIRSDFPVTKNLIYLDHASGGPIPLPVHSKIREYAAEHLKEGDLAWRKWIQRREEVRKKTARFLGADPSEITFIQSTSQGMNLVAELLASEGAVLTNTSEFPSSTLPWIWRRAKIIWQEPEDSEISLLKLSSLLSKSVTTVVTSFVQYATGFRQDLEALGNLKEGRYLVVNATQGFGAFEIDVRKWKIDFLCSNSYKWLMGGYGGGVLYLKKKWLARFRPSFIGWRSMRRPELMDNRKIEVRPEASRYEGGSPAFASIFSVGAAIDYLSAIGIQKIQKRILALTDFAIEGLLRLGLEVVSPPAPEHRSGVVVFRTKNPQKICRSLLRQKIYVSARGEGIRIAPHFYNSFEEIDIFLKKLSGVTRNQ